MTVEERVKAIEQRYNQLEPWVDLVDDIRITLEQAVAESVRTVTQERDEARAICTKQRNAVQEAVAAEREKAAKWEQESDRWQRESDGWQVKYDAKEQARSQ